MSRLSKEQKKEVLAQQTKKTLIDGLFLELKGVKGIDGKQFLSRRSAIIDLVFPSIDEPQLENIVRSESYNIHSQNDFRYLAGYILDEDSLRVEDERDEHPLKSENVRKRKIRKFVEECIEIQFLREFKKVLINLIEETDIHNNLKSKELLIQIINRLSPIEKVSNPLEQKQLEKWTETLYYYFYYAVTDKLHTNFSLSMYPKLEDDLKEYNEKVTLIYGASSNQGMFQMYSMAERREPNIICLYECAELEYYGKGLSGKVSYQKAYEFYEKAYEQHNQHPLALWATAYMRLKYDSQKAAKNKEYLVKDLEIYINRFGKNRQWYDLILNRLVASYENGCSAAANLLGQIIDDEKGTMIPKEYLERLKGLTAKQMYKESADAGYVYGCNNYSLACRKEAEGCKKKGNMIEYTNLIQESVKYLNKAVDLGDPWAVNKMAGYYYEGIYANNDVIVEKSPEKALEYYMRAERMCRKGQYYWPLINLLKRFKPQYLTERDEKFNDDYIISELKYALDVVDDTAQRIELEGLLK